MQRAAHVVALATHHHLKRLVEHIGNHRRRRDVVAIAEPLRAGRALAAQNRACHRDDCRSSRNHDGKLSDDHCATSRPTKSAEGVDMRTIKKNPRTAVSTLIQSFICALSPQNRKNCPTRNVATPQPRSSRKRYVVVVEFTP